MEKKGEYLIERMVTPVIAAECPECHAIIGQFIERDGLLYLRVGGLEMDHTPGGCTCWKCGKPYHWIRPNDMPEFIARMKNPAG